MSGIEKFFQVTHEVAHAIQLKMPVVALESTVITHGLPYPDNLSLAEDMENEVRSQAVTPATIGVFEGHIQVGMTTVQLSMLAAPDSGMMKISLRDFAPAIANLKSGGTTVAGTMFAASPCVGDRWIGWSALRA
jgi:pseudouridine-5'-phosphate glycosidase